LALNWPSLMRRPALLLLLLGASVLLNVGDCVRVPWHWRVLEQATCAVARMEDASACKHEHALECVLTQVLGTQAPEHTSNEHAHACMHACMRSLNAHVQCVRGWDPWEPRPEMYAHPAPTLAGGAGERRRGEGLHPLRGQRP